MDAYVLVQTQIGRARDATWQIDGLEGVLGVEPITGPYDLVVRVTARDRLTLNSTVLAGIQEIDGVTRAVACPIVTVTELAATGSA
jgi:hypothetical protein